MILAVGLLSGLVLTWLINPFLLHLLAEAGATRLNYRQEKVPVAMGLVFIPVYLITALVSFQWFSQSRYICFLLGIVFFGLLGLVDDLLGSDDSRGLRGHFKALRHGVLTTGALKALGGGLGALVIATYSVPAKPWWEIITAAVLIALTANAINLLDLRPGRAIKIFLLAFIIILGATRGKGPIVALYPLVGAVLAYAPADLQARAMLGDTGANLLGSSLGMVMAWSFSFHVQLAAVAFLVLLHIFTEKYSITDIVERNRALLFIDQLGRPKK
jgi:UDP-GlcNAc:undecaprenyl-phosphate GlcNAc-1-phosphate transferase